MLNGQERFDAVVLDVMLPGIDGFVVVRGNIAASAKNYVPVLMLTARGPGRRMSSRVSAAGADDYLPKPFRTADFPRAPPGTAAPQRVAALRCCRGSPRGMRRSAQMVKQQPRTASQAQNDGELFSSGRPRTIDFGALELRSPETTIHLTLMEAKLLRKLIHSQGRTVSRKSILEDVWGLREDTDTRAIDNFVVRLRRYM